MMSLTLVFWIFVVFFGAVGAMRGWAKELIVSFSVILALAIMTLLKEYVAPVQPFLGSGTTLSFWFQTAILMALAFFGYQTPNIQKLAGTRFAREKLQDILFGFVLGAFNGYLIMGSIWYFLAEAGYPFDMITPPIAGTPAGDAAARLFDILPPVILDAPLVYFAVFLSFAFVVIVFI
ncbi:MAG: hypothetical protein ACK2UW_02215 [Anaerolineales bacterium]|jgi:uncharacterized membrane protein required for colicin V production